MPNDEPRKAVVGKNDGKLPSKKFAPEMNIYNENLILTNISSFLIFVGQIWLTLALEGFHGTKPHIIDT